MQWTFRAAALGLSAALLGLSPATAGDKAGPKSGKTNSGAVKASTDGKQLGYADLADLIDKQIDQRLQSEKVTPSARSDDGEFLRRVYLDITGHIPTAEQAAAFLDSKEPNKRAKLIDELVDRPDFGRHMADIWQALLLPRNSDNRRLQSEPLVKWVEENFNKDRPWNQMVHELLTATGDQEKNGAVTYFLANGTVDKMTDNVTKVFLGVQLQCAQCHNHPFTAWKQTEYWGMAAFFMKVEATPPQMAARNGTSPEVKETDRPRRGRNALPESAKVVPAKFLGGPEAKLDKSEPYRPVLADWMATKDNPYFSKAMTNRVWAQFMGRGLVNPVDDMHDGNPASHPQLLADLAEQFAANNFDVKYLIRAICNSQAYQRTSKSTDKNADAAPDAYARSAIKVLTAEQLYDSLRTVATQGKATADPAPQRGPRGNNVGPRTQFVNFFQAEDGADPTDYQAGIPQALRLMNAAQLTNGQGALAMVKGKSQEQAVEHLYLATVSRRPTARETELVDRLMKKEEAGKVYSDLLWALLNSSEFTLNK
jgi:hypothetical protein